uniref:Uncharacterized protein n=1 Tax=Trieres chinensis TaxID=1514140 RepID=A0A7S2A0J2_TRICV|mmetsp:Transcript_3715/g.7931  ORF Transcript_3715/g.7931 Transcript_3715/m.7931 type:complete len:298 (+) Transcript_3715:20-913(+)
MASLSNNAAFSSSAATTPKGGGGGRVAVVTGSNKGIGFHVALQLAASGLFGSVLLGCRNPVLGAAAASRISESLGSGRVATDVAFLSLTLGDAESHRNFRNVVEERYGKIDVLCNNAATAFKGSDPTPFEAQCKPTLDVNFRGTVDLTLELLPLVRRGTDARIVNVASMAGHLSQLRSKELRDQFSAPDLTMSELRGLVDKFEADVKAGTHAQEGWGNSNYGLSKLAVIAATRVWAREEAKNGVTVNCCCPGCCDTDMTSHRGPRHPADGAKNAVLPATMKDPPTGQFFRDLRPSEW